MSKGSLVKGDSPRCGEMSRSDKGDGLPSGAGCEQREQTEGLKVTHALFKFHITLRNPSGLPCGKPPPFTREAITKMTEGFIGLSRNADLSEELKMKKQK